MSLIGEMHNKGVTVAWCPKASDRALIAAGTKEGAGGSFDDYGAELQLLELDFNVQNSLKIVGEIKSDVKFESLTWGRSCGPWQLGLLGGGMADGGAVDVMSFRKQVEYGPKKFIKP